MLKFVKIKVNIKGVPVMITDKIIISEDSYKSNNKYDIIYSNIKYINRLLTNGITSDNISESALKSYYVHLYVVQVKNGGFSLLDEKIDKKTTILYYIRDGLKAIRAIKNINLFNQYIIARERKDTQNYKIFNKLFNHINQDEEILELNVTWLKNNTKLAITDNINFSQINNIKTVKENEKKVNIEVLKKLCQIANEEYVRITSYDQNNLYSNSCHFKTTHSYFYMIKEKNKYVMYNSFTKREVSSMRIKKVEKNKFFSTFWSKKRA